MEGCLQGRLRYEDAIPQLTLLGGCMTLLWRRRITHAPTYPESNSTNKGCRDGFTCLSDGWARCWMNSIA